MEKRKVNAWKAAFFTLVTLLMITLVAWYALTPCGDWYTVRMYREIRDEENGTTRYPSIVPEEKAGWAAGSHDAPVREVCFHGAVSRNSGGYGPQSLHGVFAAEEVRALWPELTIAEDWPFTISMFKTNGDATFRFDLAIILPQTPDGEARATLYIFREGLPKPEIMEWTGSIGERIVFAGEV